jgi:hypothetical protein
VVKASAQGVVKASAQGGVDCFFLFSYLKNKK